MGTRTGAEAKHAAAVLLGTLGGQATMAAMTAAERKVLGRRGGVARAQRLSRARRLEIALLAAAARWRKARTTGR
jgi:hypothetical protein